MKYLDHDARQQDRLARCGKVPYRPVLTIPSGNLTLTIRGLCTVHGSRVTGHGSDGRTTPVVGIRDLLTHSPTHSPASTEPPSQTETSASFGLPVHRLALRLSLGAGRLHPVLLLPPPPPSHARPTVHDVKITLEGGRMMASSHAHQPSAGNGHGAVRNANCASWRHLAPSPISASSAQTGEEHQKVGWG